MRQHEVWDAQTGRQLTRIETGYAYRGSYEYFFLTPDWKTVYVSREKRKHMRVERGGKRLIRWEFDGDVRSWDLETGKLLETCKHNPPRNIRVMTLSPDGSAFLTNEELPGEAEGQPKWATSLWDMKTKRHQALPDGFGGRSLFSPDSKTVAVVAHDDDGYATAMKLFDIRPVREKLSIPIPEKVAFAGVSAFAPDDRTLLGYIQVFPRRKNWETWQHYLKFWDAASGKELASFPAEEKKSAILSPVFSPDGNALAAVNWEGEQGKLYLFDAATRKLVKKVILTGKRAKGERVVVREPAFSPDGRWVAVITQLFPEDRGGRDLEAEEVPQPRIHLVDVREGVVRETLVAPQGFAASACFSPDGRTLATGGNGAVLLWDLTRPPGAVGAQ